MKLKTKENNHFSNWEYKGMRLNNKLKRLKQELKKLKHF